MRQIETRYKIGDIFLVETNGNYSECIIIDIGAYSISKGSQEYIVQFIDNKFITTIKENLLIHKEHLGDILFNGLDESDK